MEKLWESKAWLWRHLAAATQTAALSMPQSRQFGMLPLDGAKVRVWTPTVSPCRWALNVPSGKQAT